MNLNTQNRNILFKTNKIQKSKVIVKYLNFGMEALKV